MNKRELVKWLEKEKSTALNKASQHKAELIDEAAQKVYASIDVDKFIAELSASFLDITRHFEDLFERASSVKGVGVSQYHWRISYNGYQSLLNDPTRLEDYVYEMIKITSEDYESSRKEAIKYYNNVEYTYDSVIQTVKNLPNAKDGMEYLDKLGFDTSSIVPMKQEKQLPATISVNVDTRYLLLNKD